MVLCNCGEIGLAWDKTSLSMYLEAIAARDPEQSADDDTDTTTLSRFLTAHSTS